MPQVAALTINDGQGTPVPHVFNPVNLTDGVQFYADQSSGVSLGFPKVSHQLRVPASNGRRSDVSRNYRLKLKVTLPEMETLGTADSGLTPPPTKAYESIFTGEFVLPERASSAHRADLLAYVRNYLADAIVTSFVEDLENTW